VFRRDRVNDPLRCSFCNKHQDQVRKLIAGPAVFICDECVEVCNDILGGEADAAETPTALTADSHVPALAIACSLCTRHISWAQALPVTDRGVLCPECVAEVQAAVDRVDAGERRP
jgi:hypothetical protein